MNTLTKTDKDRISELLNSQEDVNIEVGLQLIKGCGYDIIDFADVVYFTFIKVAANFFKTDVKTLKKLRTMATIIRDSLNRFDTVHRIFYSTAITAVELNLKVRKCAVLSIRRKRMLLSVINK